MIYKGKYSKLKIRTFKTLKSYNNRFVPIVKKSISFKSYKQTTKIKYQMMKRAEKNNKY